MTAGASAERAGDAGLPRELRAWVRGGERVLLATRPSAWAVVLESLGSLVVLVAAGSLVAVAALAWGRAGLLWDWVMPVALVAAGLRLAWQAVVVACRRYVLTDRYVLRVAGVFNRSAASLPVGRVQHVVLVRTLLERLTGTGTLGFATAGTGGVEVAWVTVDRPLVWMERARGALEGRRDEAAGRRGGAPGDAASSASAGGAGRAGPVVIGLAGGIGSGKSEVARALGERGCVVADSDKAAREALDRPEVRDQLVEWWGDSVLGPSGRVDRSRVASIVFGDAGERERLEGLVHPIVRRGRDELLESARAARAPAVVVDAPLLFEAGLDAECDVVIFVDAPRGERERRVRETRGWDSGELARREKVQLSLDAKRDRSDYQLQNDADPEALRSRVWQLLDSILASHRGRGSDPEGRDAS